MGSCCQRAGYRSKVIREKSLIQLALLRKMLDSKFSIYRTIYSYASSCFLSLIFRQIQLLRPFDLSFALSSVMLTSKCHVFYFSFFCISLSLPKLRKYLTHVQTFFLFVDYICTHKTIIIQSISLSDPYKCNNNLSCKGKTTLINIL